MTQIDDIYQTLEADLLASRPTPEIVALWMESQDWYRLDAEHDDHLMFNTNVNGRRRSSEGLSLPRDQHSPFYYRRLIDLIAAVGANSGMSWSRTLDSLLAFAVRQIPTLAGRRA